MESPNDMQEESLQGTSDHSLTVDESKSRTALQEENDAKIHDSSENGQAGGSCSKSSLPPEPSGTISGMDQLVPRVTALPVAKITETDTAVTSESLVPVGVCVENASLRSNKDPVDKSVPVVDDDEEGAASLESLCTEAINNMDKVDVCSNQPADSARATDCNVSMTDQGLPEGSVPLLTSEIPGFDMHKTLDRGSVQRNVSAEPVDTGLTGPSPNPVAISKSVDSPKVIAQNEVAECHDRNDEFACFINLQLQCQRAEGNCEYFPYLICDPSSNAVEVTSVLNAGQGGKVTFLLRGSEFGIERCIANAILRITVSNPEGEGTACSVNLLLPLKQVRRNENRSDSGWQAKFECVDANITITADVSLSVTTKTGVRREEGLTVPNPPTATQHIPTISVTSAESVAFTSSTQNSQLINNKCQFRCTENGCGQIFTNNSSLSRHRNKDHFPNKLRSCTNCGYRPNRPYLLDRHEQKRVCYQKGYKRSGRK